MWVLRVSNGLPVTKSDERWSNLHKVIKLKQVNWNDKNAGLVLKVFETQLAFAILQVLWLILACND